jgi:hypothetical protein
MNIEITKRGPREGRVCLTSCWQATRTTLNEKEVRQLHAAHEALDALGLDHSFYIQPKLSRHLTIFPRRRVIKEGGA